MTTRVPESYVHAYDDNGCIIINASNLKPTTAVNAKINFYDAYNNKFSYPLSSVITKQQVQPLTIIDELLGDTNQLPAVAPLTSPLVTVSGDSSTLPRPAKTTFLHNYWNNDLVTYPLVRLYGEWIEQRSGNITVTLNGSAQGINWQFYNNEFKVYVKLSSSAQANGKNDIVLSCGAVSKTITLYFNKPSISGTTPHIKCILYDTYDGDGTCDTIPSRTDNTLEHNKDRLKLDMMLLQSFFAESMRYAREFQEGIIGLPYTTFVMELDNTDTPSVYYLKSQDPEMTKQFFLLNRIDVRGTGRMDARVTAEFGNGYSLNGGPIYVVGYTLVSHKIPGGLYYGGVAEGGGSYAMMNAANLIWHPKSLDEFQLRWNDTTALDDPAITYYIELDNAYTATDSCSRIIGSLMHEIAHVFGIRHPAVMISTTNNKPLAYTFPFDREAYGTPFGIEDNDAIFLRNWVMSYNLDATHTPISRVNSELGPSSRGWFSPYGIQGYVSNYDASFLQSKRSVMDSDNMIMIGFRHNKLLQPHAKESPIFSYTTAGLNTVAIPVDLNTGYIVANIWGAGGGGIRQKGGAGGFIRAVIPIKNTDIIEIVIGDRDIGGGGVANPQSGGPYGGNGGGYTILYINKNPLYIAAGGGGGGSDSPGISNLQQTKFIDNEDGDSGKIPATGQSNFATNQQGGCGGSGWYGGYAGTANHTGGGGGGAGSSFCYKQFAGSSFEKAGYIATYSENWGLDPSRTTFSQSYPCKHIPLNVFDTNPTNVGSSNNPGYVKLHFIYTSNAKNEAALANSPQSTSSSFPAVDYSDSPDFNTIMPRPSVYNSTGDICRIYKSATNIVVANEFVLYAPTLITDLQNFGIVASYTIGTTAAAATENPPILLKYDTTLVDTVNKYYKHSCLVEPGKITVSAHNITGISFGTSTIIQLLRHNGNNLEIGTCEVQDYSTCHRTGIMIDTARTYHSQAEYYHYVDMCRFYKMSAIHLHATDKEGFLLPYDPSPGIISELDSAALVDYRANVLPGLHTLMTNVKNYAAARGIKLVPEWELSDGHWNNPFPNTFTRNPTTACLNAVEDLIKNICDFFDKSEYFHIGNDEGEMYFVTNNSTFTTFGNEHNINVRPSLSSDTKLNNIRDYWYYKIWQFIESKNKKMIVWNPVNVDYIGTDNVRYTTNNQIAYQAWLANGGASGSTNYKPEGEDFSKNDLHTYSLYAMSQGVSVFQSPWKPRIYNSMRSMFDWSVGGQIATTNDGLTTDDFLHSSYPLPINDKLLGSETLLWVQDFILRQLYFSYKAPIRNENTHSFGKPTISAITFGKTFNYNDTRFIEFNHGVRIIETGVSETMGDRIVSGIDDSMIPTQILRNTATIAFVLNNPTDKIYYVLSSTKFPAAYQNGRYHPSELFSSAIEYSSPIQVSVVNDGITNGFIALRAQVYNSSNQPIGSLINRKYIIRGFKVNIAGCMPRLLNYEAKLDTTFETETLTYYFNGQATISVSDILPDSTIRYSVGGNLSQDSPTLSESEQLVITGTVPKVTIGCYKNNVFLFGNIVSYTLLYTQDVLKPSDLLYPPFSISKTVKPIFLRTYTYTTAGTQKISLSSLVSGIANCPGGLKISVLVIGAGGSTVSGGKGGGSGGASSEIYPDIDRLKIVTITVGGPSNKTSSVSFAYQGEDVLYNSPGRSYYPPGVDRDRVNAYQLPIYPIVAHGGTNGTLTTPGIQGSVSYGESTSFTPATDTAGGGGYEHEGTTYGNGAYGSVAAGGGFVMLTIEPL
jgi:hypothetical protein